MKLTAVILTKNEENTIVDCINSVVFADQILVIDDESTDRTIEIVKNINNPKIHIRTHTLQKNFSQQRNYALSQATGEWVLFVDADERVSDALAREIETVINASNFEGYHIVRKDFLWGKELHYGETGSTKLVRLAKKKSGKWVGSVHETWDISGKVGELANPLLHYPHQTISEFLHKVNVYSTMRAEELFAQKVRSNIFWIVTYPKMKFIKNYFVLQGYKDSTAGFVHAMIMSFHSFLVRAKLYLLWKGIKNS